MSHVLIEVCCGSADGVIQARLAGAHRAELTSGQETDVSYGTDTVRERIAYARGGIQIMPGTGITLRNAARIVQETGEDRIRVAAHKSVYDRSVENNRSIFCGGCLNPPEDRFSMIGRDVIHEIKELV